MEPIDFTTIGYFRLVIHALTKEYPQILSFRVGYDSSMYYFMEAKNK